MIAMSGKRRWTHEEDEMLREMWGAHPIDTICAKLGRSRAAIAVRKDRLKLGRFYDASEYITVNRLHKILSGKNVNSYQLISWVQNRGLPIMNKTRGPGYKVRCIHLKDFWKWAEKNRDFIDFSKFERNALGPEPDWVAEQRKFDEQKKLSVTMTPWTPADDEKLLAMLKQYKYSTPEIAARLRRTEGAVIRRISTLGIKYRPLRGDPHTPWTDEEIGLLDDLIRGGCGYSVMALKIERHSEKAIRGLVWRTYGTENLDKVRQQLQSE